MDHSETHTITVGSLCTGYGGLDMGLARALHRLATGSRTAFYVENKMNFYEAFTHDKEIDGYLGNRLSSVNLYGCRVYNGRNIHLYHPPKKLTLCGQVAFGRDRVCYSYEDNICPRCAKEAIKILPIR